MEITRYRGDTKPIVMTFWQDKSAGTLFDLTDCEVYLTVDPEKAPIDDTNNLFTLTGQINTPTLGKATFTLTEMQANITPATYYYDIELVDAGGYISTEALDKFKIIQDIKK